MRTFAYVDGYNLYHGRLKYTPFKWLDLQGLLSSMLRIQTPSSDLAAVKLFTASIKARYARRGQESVAAQNTRIAVLLLPTKGQQHRAGASGFRQLYDVLHFQNRLRVSLDDRVDHRLSHFAQRTKAGGVQYTTNRVYPGQPGVKAL